MKSRQDTQTGENLMKKTYTIRIYDNENKTWDETTEKYTLREARKAIRIICDKINKKYGILLKAGRFDITIMKNGKYAFPKLNKDLNSIICN